MGELGMGWIDSQGIRAAGDPGTIWSTLLPHRCGNQAQEAEVLAWVPTAGRGCRQGLNPGLPAPTPVG